MAAAPEIFPDTEHRGLVGMLPAAVRPYALLARFDRPIGWWLLFWPGAWAVALSGNALVRWDLILWFLLGSIAMRSSFDCKQRVKTSKASGALALNASRMSAGSFERPPGLPLWPFWKPPLPVGFVILHHSSAEAAALRISDPVSQ